MVVGDGVGEGVGHVAKVEGLQGGMGVHQGGKEEDRYGEDMNKDNMDCKEN